MNFPAQSELDNSDLPVKDRLLSAGKFLFASNGFENTSTASIVKIAKTSESQLFKHFGDKEGLIEAIFQEGWKRMAFVLTASKIAHSPAEKLNMILELMLNALDSDPELRDLMLLEGRRFRKVGGKILVTNGYSRFAEYIENIIEELKSQGHIVPELSSGAVRTVLVGAFESLMREQVLAQRGSGNTAITTEEIRTGFLLVLKAVMK